MNDSAASRKGRCRGAWPVEDLRHQRKTGCRIVSHGRDLRLSLIDCACLMAHRKK
jgi:hypothetical protein